MEQNTTTNPRYAGVAQAKRMVVLLCCAWLFKSKFIVQSMALFTVFHDRLHHRCVAGAMRGLHTTSSSLIFRNSFSPDEEVLTPPAHGPSLSSSDIGPWNQPQVLNSALERRSRKNNNARFRQHVNPLAGQYQRICDLPPDWPGCSFRDLSKPLHIDIGCGKGGFLIDLVESQKSNNDTDANLSHNYLGLEIRPLVAQYARTRVRARKAVSPYVDILGCNANVDLRRILERYAKSSLTSSGPVVDMVTIQFPDPHFKNSHAKRRVVTPSLVDEIARYVRPLTGQVFLQSDVKAVLDDMRRHFANAHVYFEDARPTDVYFESNIFGVSTEREASVISRGLPVYRALFTRTGKPFE